MIVWNRGIGAGPAAPDPGDCDGGGGGGGRGGNLPSSFLGIKTARNHILLLRFRFSTVVELMIESCIELPAIPSENNVNRADMPRIRK